MLLLLLDSRAELGDNVHIGPYAVIESNVILKEYCVDQLNPQSFSDIVGAEPPKLFPTVQQLCL